jgi:hypothetical protein
MALAILSESDNVLNFISFLLSNVSQLAGTTGEFLKQTSTSHTFGHLF